MNFLKKDIVYNELFKKLGDKILEYAKEYNYEVTDNYLTQLKDLPFDILKMLRRMKEYKFKDEEEFLDKLKISFYTIEKFSVEYKEKIESIKTKLELLIYKDKNVTRSYDIFALGTWYHEDTKIIKHLIHARDKEKGGYAALASFCLEPQKCEDEVYITLETLRPDYPTIRVIRQYHLEENEFKQINRIDWEPSKELLESPKYKPCAWIFAGTKSASEEEKKKEDKLPDFKSRMTIIVDMDYESLKEKYMHEPGVGQLKKEARLEQVYIGAIKIRDNFPDVSKVSEAILKKFYELDPSENPYREIRKLAASLQNVQYGIVKRKNCTSYEWKERLGTEYSNWLDEKENEKDFIELIFAHRFEKER